MTEMQQFSYFRALKTEQKQRATSFFSENWQQNVKTTEKYVKKKW